MNKKNKEILIYTFSVLFLLLFVVIGFSASSILENDVKVTPNSELIYYLNVTYDGVDKWGIESSDSTRAEISSNIIHVEDKIPEGLIFNGFITTSTGSIGAIGRNDGQACTGSVVDNTDGTETLNSYHGLYYDETTKTVSFDVKNLQAGCVLTVGIKTKTPTVDDPTTPERELRRDFYNFATFQEENFTGKSNTVHTWMGTDELAMYKVTYIYEGEVPEGAPSAPEEMEYVTGTQVGVANTVNVEGYKFSGWKTEDAVITSGSFKMPAQNVILKGNFEKIPKNKVIYEIEGITPDEYFVPLTKEYYPSSKIKVDSMKKGDIFNGYRFLGWTIENITIDSDNEFDMPSNDVVIIGKFEEVKYSVSYQFYDGILPPNSDSLLPETKEYKAGEKVILENVKEEPNGYAFLGWYKEKEFIMPENDIVIYGEWKIQNGLFSPTITKEVIGTKEYYQPGDIVKYQVTVTNNANFEIKNVIVKENNEKAYFIDGIGYEVASPHNVRISSIPANSSVIIYAEYKVSTTDHGTIKNEVEVTGALADNDYELDPNGIYKDDAYFKVKSKIKICKEVDENKVAHADDKFQINIKGESYDSWIILESGECGYAYVTPGTYTITEVLSQDYSLEKIEGSISSNGETITIEPDKTYNITFYNKYKNNGFFHSVGRVVNKIVNAFKLE